MDNSESNIVVIILAGGKGSRMGSIKQLLPWKHATLLENTIEQAKNSEGSDIIVVLGAHASEIRSKISTNDVIFVDNAAWEHGLGTSISCGVNYILKNKYGATGVLILLADQPLIDTQYINKMIETFIKKSNGLVTTNYGSREGVPAIFAQKFFLELQDLNQDFGAKELIRKNMHLTISIDPEGKETDIDTLTDYNTLLKELPEEN